MGTPSEEEDLLAARLKLSCTFLLSPEWVEGRSFAQVRCDSGRHAPFLFYRLLHLPPATCLLLLFRGFQPQLVRITSSGASFPTVYLRLDASGWLCSEGWGVWEEQRCGVPLSSVPCRNVSLMSPSKTAVTSVFETMCARWR